MFTLRYFLILIVLAVFYTAVYSGPVGKPETTTEKPSENSENQLKDGEVFSEKNIVDCFAEYVQALTELMAAMVGAMSDVMEHKPQDQPSNHLD